MDNCLESLEKNVESLRKVMEEREANVSKNMEFMWKRMEEWDEFLNQQMEDMRAMLISFMTQQTYNQDERFGVGVLVFS